MFKVLLKVIKAIGMAGLTVCILPFVLVGMLLLSIVRLIICIGFVLKSIKVPQFLKNEVPVGR